MKKFKDYLPIIIVLICLISSRILAQSPPCNFTTCTPFGNSDNKQIYSAIRSNSIVSLNGGTVAVSITSLNVQDNNEDTLNNRLGSIRSASYYGTLPQSFILKDIADRNIVTGGIYLGNSTADLLVQVKQGIDTVNQTGRQTVTTLTASTLNVKIVNSSATLSTSVQNTVSTSIVGVPTVAINGTVNTNVTNTISVAAHNVSVVNTVTVAPHTVSVTNNVVLANNSQLTGITNTLVQIGNGLYEMQGLNPNSNTTGTAIFEEISLAALQADFNAWLTNPDNASFAIIDWKYAAYATKYSIIILYR